MPCDAGRARAVLKWCLIDGKGDANFRRHQEGAQAAVLVGSEVMIDGHCYWLLRDHDMGSYHCINECHREEPGTILTIGREIMGVTGKSVPKASPETPWPKA